MSSKKSLTSKQLLQSAQRNMQMAIKKASEEATTNMEGGKGRRKKKPTAKKTKKTAKRK